MKASRRTSIKRPNMRRAVILFPSGFTLGNLFFGVFAIIAASRLEFVTAGVYVMLGGMCDALDGRVARATNSGTEFGEELDSLVDAVTFGLAPAMIMYFAVLNRDNWDWLFVFLFCACAVLRLARFNIEQAGTAKTYFQGLPSPAAGITLASYYAFSQSWMYDYAAVGNLPWHKLLRFIMAGLAILMISNVPYPNFPRTGFRSIKAALASLLLITCAVLFFWLHRLEFFFPLALIYVVFGVFRWVFSGLFERRQPTVPYDLSEGEDEEDDEMFEVPTSAVHAERAHRRTEPAPRVERGRGRGERAEPAERPARPARTDAVRVERDAEAPRAERPERPERTEAERAARREKRDKRDQKRGKREDRPERTPLATVAPVADAAAPGGEAVIATIVPPALAAMQPDDASTDEGVIGTIPGGADSDASAAGSGATRKRKRRRRRGARDRGDTAGGAEGGDSSGGDEGGFEDDGPDDGNGGGEGSGGSPYSAATPPEPPAARPYTPPLPAPTPTERGE